MNQCISYYVVGAFQFLKIFDQRKSFTFAVFHIKLIHVYQLYLNDIYS